MTHEQVEYLIRNGGAWGHANNPNEVNHFYINRSGVGSYAIGLCTHSVAQMKRVIIDNIGKRCNVCQIEYNLMKGGGFIPLQIKGKKPVRKTNARKHTKVTIHNLK